MAYSKSILPRTAAYYSLSNASIEAGELQLSAGGFAEIQVSSQMLPKLTASMLVVIHPSQFSNSYTNDAVQVTVSIITSSGSHIEYLIPVTYSSSGVFNTVITLPEETFASFTYRISSKIALSVYNWELCAEEAVDVTTVINGVEQSLPKLLYDYNTYAYAVAQKELTVGLISCYLLNATDLQGHFTISFFATERCNVHIRIKDNGITELYTPIVYTVEKGYATVSVPHAYLKKRATEHAFSVTIQCTNGQLSIPVRGMLYTIDGGYLATRLLDAGVDVEDISIKQLATDASPSEIFAVGFEGDRILLKKRVYSQAVREDWQAVKDFGEGLHAGVEFAGSWTYRAGADRFTIETEASPHVFIVGTDGTLIDYYGESFNSTFVLDTGVTSLSVCLGYNSLTDTSFTQGLVCAYVKNGNVYYRQWMLDTTFTEFIWHGAAALYEGGDAQFVSVHRLPDYRLGICVQHGTGTTWYITDRTYVSQGIKPEVINTLTNEVMVTTVYDTSSAPESMYHAATKNTFEATSDTFNGFSMTFEGPLVFLRGRTTRTLNDDLTVSINGIIVNDIVDTISISNNVMLVNLKYGVRAGSTVTIRYNCPYIAMVAYNGGFASILQEYTWNLPNPVIQTAVSENVSANVSGTLNVEVKPLITKQISHSESIQASTTAVLNATVYEIITRNISTAAEDINVSIPSTTLNLTVSQVGTKPI